MKIKRTLFLIFFGFISIKNWSQQTEIYQSQNINFNKAIQLYHDGQYQAAQILFDKIKFESKSNEQISECDYYVADCAIKTNQNGADELMESFIKNNPTSTKQNQAATDVAHFYFSQGNYQKSLEWYERVDEGNLTYEDQERANFQRGYANFSIKKFPEATKYFKKITSKSKYASQAKYYQGFLAYESNDYEKATELFDQVEDKEKYKDRMGYFQADMNFKSGNFKKAIEIGEEQLKKSNAQEKTELSKIIGESYFNLKQYDKALPYLLAYRGKNGKWSNTDFYQLGYVYYQQKDYEKAIANFNKIVAGNDAVAQNAYYHLAESYLNSGQKQQALTAFKSASEMNFDKKIQEDATINYAKLSYEIGNAFTSVPEVLKSAIELYPNNPNKAELNNFLISSYITSKNYTEALELLEKSKTPENKLAYQKVLFYRGLELFTDGKNNEAYNLFKKAISENRDPKILARASFWKAECEYVNDNFSDAIISYKQFLELAEAKNVPEIKNANYNLAYSYFKTKDYNSSIPYYNKHIEINKNDKVRLYDSYLRVADCNFISAKYWPALDAYNKVIETKGNDADYAAFQKAMCYGFTNKNDKKIEDLVKFTSTYTASQYMDDALYELGNSYANADQNDRAIATFDKLATNYKNSSYLSKAVLKQGLIYYNTDKDDLALNKFKKVANDYPATPEALEAVATAKNIYTSQGKVDEYATWVKSLSYIEVSEKELDDDMFTSAEKLDQANKLDQAIPAYKAYLKEFPNGAKALKTNYTLAEIYTEKKNEKEAEIYYKNIIDRPRNEYSERALVKLSEMYLKNKDNENAMSVLKRLETEADFPQNVTFAQANLMRMFYEKQDYTNSELYADKVLKNPKTENKVKSDAQIVIARSAIKTGNEAKARESFAKLQKIAKGELAAEALYYEAYFKNKDGKFEASNKLIEKYSNTYSGYKYYGAKSLIIMAKNFYGLKDSFQATEILQSVIDNFSEYSDVISEAKTELDKVKAEESKTNSSIGNK